MKSMTQKKLMVKCFFRAGECSGCPYTVWCNMYKEKYGCEPYEDEDIHPERFTSEELVVYEKEA